jgi:predicted secreted Zn-dependent protease
MAAAGKFRHFAGAVSLGAACFAAAHAMADMRIASDTRYYTLRGETLESLARELRSNPIEGDHGAAIANVRPDYDLRIGTREAGGMCRATTVDLHIRFQTILPRANEAGMSGRTRSYWRTLIAFATRHEAGHRAIYAQCARSLLIRAQRLASRQGCMALQADIRRLFGSAKDACERRQDSYDRREASRLRNLPIFALTHR